ncbi:hypothetical protein ES705_31536 [subsurface metagenome]
MEANSLASLKILSPISRLCLFISLNFWDKYLALYSESVSNNSKANLGSSNLPAAFIRGARAKLTSLVPKLP